MTPGIVRVGDTVRRPVRPPALVGADIAHRAAARTDPVFRRLWERGVRERMPRAEAWIAAEGPAIAERLSGRPSA
ncbi:hypothetical protein ACFXKD_06850 [Nocardiopsis aegyptia]|uniref:hypothetical protein n=1 Tax=Nocardiopsis aegyptia TaxID=220378 RepID=UPI00366C9505